MILGKGIEAEPTLRLPLVILSNEGSDLLFLVLAGNARPLLNSRACNLLRSPYVV